MIISAFASTCSALVSNLIGAGRETEVMSLIRRHLWLTYGIVVPLVALFALFPDVILGVYTNIPELLEAAVPSLWVYCTTPLLIAPGNVYFQAVSGTGNTRMAFVLEFVTLVVYTLYICNHSSASFGCGLVLDFGTRVRALYFPVLLCLPDTRVLEAEENLMTFFEVSHPDKK